jgi:tryptophan-rich sensory protein
MESEWYDSLNKSRFTPPGWVFGVVWPILYVMMVVALFLVWKSPECRPFCLPVLFFFIQLGFNLMWTPVFFGQKRVGLGLAIIFATLFSVLHTMYLFYPISPIAMWLLFPYAVWLAFATYLNWYIYNNN